MSSNKHMKDFRSVQIWQSPSHQCPTRLEQGCSKAREARLDFSAGGTRDNTHDSRLRDCLCNLYHLKCLRLPPHTDAYKYGQQDEDYDFDRHLHCVSNGGYTHHSVVSQDVCWIIPKARSPSCYIHVLPYAAPLSHSSYD